MSTSSSSVGAWSPTASWRPCRARDTEGGLPRHGGRRGGPGALRPGRPQRLLLRLDPGGPPPRGPHDCGTTRRSPCAPGTTATGIDRAAARSSRPRTAGRTPTTTWCSPPARTPGCRPVPGRRRHGRLRLPHHRRPRRPARLGRAAAAELGRPARGAVVGGGLLGLEAAGALVGLGAHCTVVEFAPRLMALQVDEGGGTRCAGSSRGWASTSASARQRVDRRRRRRPGRRAAASPATRTTLPADVVVFATACGRATSWPGPPGWRPARAAASSSTRRCRTDGPAGLRDRRGRLHRGALPGARRARLHDGRGRRRPAARRRGDLPGRRPVDQAQAARRRRRVVRRRVRDDAGRARARATPTRSPASTRSSSSPTTPARCSAASSSATRRRTPSLRPMVGRRARRRPGPVAAARERRRRATPGRPARRGRGLLLQQRHRRRRPRARSPSTGCHDVGVRQGVHAGPARRAARASRSSRS